MGSEETKGATPAFISYIKIPWVRRTYEHPPVDSLVVLRAWITHWLTVDHFRGKVVRSAAESLRVFGFLGKAEV